MEPDWLKTAREKGLIAKEYGAAAGAADQHSRSTPTDGSAVPLAAVACSSEKEFQEHVVALAERNGWRVAHCRKVLVKQGKQTRYETPMAPGWPDLTLAKPGRLLFFELKFGDNRPTHEQCDWGELLQSVAGCQWLVLWPDDWDIIHRLLTE